ncbi:unnamed protein product [Caenorhabditis sp. 36 PRJEB53466]|nr:unnamed protein product [Caenorhabditis sp. 36 PRJEB53466]
MEKRAKSVLNAALFLLSISIVVAVLAAGYIVSDVSEFRNGIQDDMKEFQFYSSDSWNVMLSKKTVGFRVRRQYSNAPVGGGGQIEDGTCQCAEQSTGCPHGPPGAPGTPGHPGDVGTAGSPGQPGSPGISEMHASLMNGCITCPRGPPGSPGPDGPPGPLGSSGNAGRPGSAGPQGRPGPPGQLGPPGPNGNPGAPGNDGTPGVPGTRQLSQRGPFGPPGPMGPPGSPGNDGQFRNGPPGPPGAMGPSGTPGAPGGVGSNGNPGSDGMPGPDGEYCTCPRRTPNLGVAGYQHHMDTDTGIGFSKSKIKKLKKMMRKFQKRFYSTNA